jgi:hypothetical protein
VIPSDPVQPRENRGARRVVPPGVAHRRQKHFLGHVLCDGRRCSHVQRKAVNLPLAAAKKDGKRFRVPSRHLADQLAVLKVV